MSLFNLFGKGEALAVAFVLFAVFFCPVAQAAYGEENSRVDEQQRLQVVGATKVNPTTVDVLFSNQQRLTLDFYGENIFRLFQDNAGGILRDPAARPEAKILVARPRKEVSVLDVEDTPGTLSVTTAGISVQFDKNSALMKVIDLKTGKTVLETTEPVLFQEERVTLKLKEHPQEYFYGGGVQNGRFSHKGKIISIENQNSWTDGGVASPNPFYWSTNGYGVLWHTFKKGVYDFGREEENTVTLYHETDYLDLFVLVNDGAAPLLNEFCLAVRSRGLRVCRCAAGGREGDGEPDQRQAPHQRR